MYASTDFITHLWVLQFISGILWHSEEYTEFRAEKNQGREKPNGYIYDGIIPDENQMLRMFSVYSIIFISLLTTVRM